MSVAEQSVITRASHEWWKRPDDERYLTLDDLYRAIKDQGLPASELLQKAVRSELRRRRLLDETDHYLTELISEVGEPSKRAIAQAEALAARLKAGSEKTRAS